MRILPILLLPLVFLAGCGTNVYHVSSPDMKWVWAKEHKVNAVLEPVKYLAGIPITESGEKLKSVTMVTNFEKKLVKHLKIHIISGLRTNNLFLTYQEEICRLKMLQI